MQILVARGDHLTGQALCEELQACGAQCRFANSGAAMIAALQSQSFDWVLFDLVMHDMTGEEAWTLAQEMFEPLPRAIAFSQTNPFDPSALSQAMGVEACLSASSSVEEVLRHVFPHGFPIQTAAIG